MRADEDDDLPLLTDVLRVRAPGMREALDPRRAPPDEAPADPEAAEADACREEPRDEELVIGTVPEADAKSNRAEVEVIPESFDGIAPPEDTEAIAPRHEDESAAAAPVAFDSDAMAASVRDAVLEDLAQRIDTELDARLAQSVTAQLESALAGLQSGLRASLADALSDVVRRAVDEQIMRARTTRDS